MAGVRDAETHPPLTHKLKCQDWAKKYLKRDFSGFMGRWNGSDSWQIRWMGLWLDHLWTQSHFESARWRRGTGVSKDELVGHWQVKDLPYLNSSDKPKINQFSEETFFKQWYRKKSASFKKVMILMQGNAPSQASTPLHSSQQRPSSWQSNEMAPILVWPKHWLVQQDICEGRHSNSVCWSSTLVQYYIPNNCACSVVLLF